MDAAAFFSTAIAVLAVNAVAAVVVGCSMYALQKIYARLSAPSMNLPSTSLEATSNSAQSRSFLSVRLQ
jgi:hypothetical protein